ncbi:cryptochrome/photolyase family protein [Candidatus Poriferisodalis sp.]|uniref:cryptochrome/photolyase family protein n=1 Tax=Candidatus Poriferisodalis sp. TaxID=3101277 RepID=UPI003B0118DC
MDDVAIAWFRRDLRLADNPAWAAATAHQVALPVAVLEPRLVRAAGPHRLLAYFGALAGLEQSLNELDASLHVVVGDPIEVISQLAVETGGATVAVNADVTEYSMRRDAKVAEALGRPLDSHWGTLVHPPGSVLTGKGTLSQVFTPFWKRWQALPLPPAVGTGRVGVAGTVLAADLNFGPAGLTTISLAEARSELERLGVSVPSVDDVPTTAAWSEPRAAEQLTTWLEQVDRYNEIRDGFDIAGTSELSSALHFGLLSPRAIAAQVATGTAGRSAFVRQLAWRDWYSHLTYEHPDITRRALRPAYDRIKWRTGAPADQDFKAWSTGRCGYPIVDAAMRQLSATGWIHNRLRMIAASFLVKDLLIDWRRGEQWFRRLLRDGDIAQNAGNWQWCAGTGPDASPYFRVFSPVTQSRRYDPEGNYLRRWLPELARLPNRQIHAPWDAPPQVLSVAGVRLGVDYPAPVVDHAQARQRALDAYRCALDTETDSA